MCNYFSCVSSGFEIYLTTIYTCICMHIHIYWSFQFREIVIIFLDKDMRLTYRLTARFVISFCQRSFFPLFSACSSDVFDSDASHVGVWIYSQIKFFVFHDHGVFLSILLFFVGFLCSVYFSNWLAFWLFNDCSLCAFCYSGCYLLAFSLRMGNIVVNIHLNFALFLLCLHMGRELVGESE